VNDPILVWSQPKPAMQETAWVIAKHYIYQQGDNRIGFEWDGPLWKPENRYLTNEGWPLGTTCWFVRVTLLGHGRRLFCSDSFMQCIWEAHLYIKESVEQRSLG
jgi:hypothetical protein